uniref:Endonuclease V n=1 Tax=Plectus sambesii TaxID=2011161 RepID=A0A914XCG9_9BILA
EAPIKYGTTILYSAFAVYGLRFRFGLESLHISKIEAIYMLGFIPLEIYKELIADYVLGQRFQFLSLMITSIYCAVGIFYVWLKFCWIAFLKEELIPVYKWLWRREQNRLKSKLIVDNSESWQKEFGKKGEGLRYIGGLDISTSLYDNGCACACFVILSYPELEIVHQETAAVVIDRPYIAGYLAFREAESLAALIARVRRTHPDIFPQVILIDGNGILHPQRFGLASHIGVLADVPTIGVAKNLHHMDDLVKYDDRSAKANRRALITDDGTVLGEAVCATSDAKNPVFVSIGHRITLDTAVAVVSRCSKYRVPEPTRLADQISRQLVRQWWDN